MGEDRQKFGRVAGRSEGARQKEEVAQRCTYRVQEGRSKGAVALSTVGRNVRTRVQWPQVDAVNSKGAVAPSRCGE